MRILLVCNAGMSSSILIGKIKEAAKRQNKDIVVGASPMQGISEEKGLWDVCLIGPQISYAVDNVKEILGIPILAIEPRIYALADGEKALILAEKLYNATK